MQEKSKYSTLYIITKVWCYHLDQVVNKRFHEWTCPKKKEWNKLMVILLCAIFYFV